MGLWYKKTMLECGMLESCWTRTIRRSVDLPVPLRTKNNRHKVNTCSILNTVATHNSDTQNSETYPNSDTLLALTKMSLLRYVKDFGKKSIDFL